MIIKWCKRLLQLGAMALILILLLFSLSFAILQSKWAKDKVSALITTSLSKAGWHVELKGLCGTPPFQWTIHKIEMTKETQGSLEMRDVKIRLAFFPLLKKHLVINYMHVPRLTLHNTRWMDGKTFEADAKAHLSKKGFSLELHLCPLEDPASFAHLLLQGNTSLGDYLADWDVQGDLVHLTGHAKFHEDHLTYGKTSLLLPNLSLLSSDLQGELVASATFQDEQIHCDFFTQDLSIRKQPFQKIEGSMDAENHHPAWSGTLQLTTQEEEFPFALQSRFSLYPRNLKNRHLDLPQSPANPHANFSGFLGIKDFSILEISDFTLDGKWLNVAGKMEIELPECSFNGALYANVESFERLSPFYPELEISGRGGIDLIFTKKEEQQIKLFALLKNLHVRHLLIDDLLIQATIHAPFNHPSGYLLAEAHHLYTPQFYLTSTTFYTQSEENNWRFNLQTNGTWQDPLSLNTAGLFSQTADSFTLTLNELNGEVLNKQVELPHPCTFEKTPTSLKVEQCELLLGEGSFFLNGILSSEQRELELKATHFPLSLFTIAESHFSLNGWVTAQGKLNDSEGFFNLVLEHAALSQVQAKGSVQAHLSQNTLQVHADVKATGEQFLDLTATLPLTSSLKIDATRPLSAELITEGALEEIFDFVNMGAHHATGFISSRLFLSNTFQTPHLLGQIALQHGTYENDYTGTSLKEICATIEASNHQIQLRELFAKDDSSGRLAATGELSLLPQENFPYTLQAELNHLHTLRFDTIDSHFTGPISIHGTTKSATAQGDLVVTEANFKISEELPVDLPILPLTYIHKPPHLDLSSLSPLPSFPLHLDLNLSAPDHIFVHGQGLNSEWEGAVHLTGTNADVAASGKLHMIKGEYVFSGKIFKLTEGEILFSDKPTPSAYLNLSGILDLSDLIVTAYLRGPLTAPQLTFQSNPHMPTSAILARILFNKEISDISHPEAIQLANTLISLSGGAGPDVLDAIRRTLGVDRLTIVSARPGTDQVAVQIGKYLVRGVMITLSQSATSSQVIVEVELNKGFVFKAETQNEEEGKFTLKWNCNY